MPSISKLLVVGNFVVSVMVAGWAMGFYFTRIDWTDVPPKEKAQPGQLSARKNELTSLLSQARAAETSWREARVRVREREAFRAEDRAFYRSELTYIYNAPPAEQLREFVVGKDGLPELQADPRAKSHSLLQRKNINERNGKPLRSLSFYAQTYAANLKGLKAVGDELEKLFIKDGELTVELNGGGADKGLNQRIQDERLKGIGVLEEYNIIKPLLIKTVGDSQFLLARRQQLEKRIKELEESPVSKPQ
jgi:hypothetical protein